MFGKRDGRPGLISRYRSALNATPAVRRGYRHHFPLHYTWLGKSQGRQRSSPILHGTIGAYMLYCFGYIGAITDTLLDGSEVDRPRLCLPADQDEVRLRDVVVNFLRKNEPMRGFTAPRLVTRALYETFPCR
jgi:hypothetical protein